jgi:3',5'-cyclic AMP phosphodiesterase CpdA
MRRILKIVMTMKKLLLFCTILAAASCSPRTYTIVQIADAQLGFDAAVKGSAPGAQYVNDLTFEVECLKATVAKVNELKPDAVVFTGDQVHLPYDIEQWNAFMQITADIDPSIKVYHLPGNHDHILKDGTADPSDFISRFGYDRFVAEEGKVNLIGLNTSLIYFNSDLEQDQKQWLESALADTKKRDVTLIFGHHPFFCENIDEDDTHVQIPKSKRYMYFYLFAEADVDAVFAGHLHDNRTAEYEGIPMLTTTSSGYQLGDAPSSVRLITVSGRKVKEELVPIF